MLEPLFNSSWSLKVTGMDLNGSAVNVYKRTVANECDPAGSICANGATRWPWASWMGSEISYCSFPGECGQTPLCCGQGVHSYGMPGGGTALDRVRAAQLAQAVRPGGLLAIWPQAAIPGGTMHSRVGLICPPNRPSWPIWLSPVAWKWLTSQRQMTQLGKSNADHDAETCCVGSQCHRSCQPTNLLAHLGPQPTSCPEHGVKAYLCLADFCFFLALFFFKVRGVAGAAKKRKSGIQ